MSAHEATVIDVVALVAERDGRVLVARRPATKRHGGLYEFPGGKVHAGESLQDALIREVAEELDTGLTTIEPTGLARQEPGSRYRIHFLKGALTGSPRCVEHTALLWADTTDLNAIPLAPVDAWFVRAAGLGRSAAPAPEP